MMHRTEHNFWLDLVLFAILSITTVTGFVLWLAAPPGPSHTAWITAHVGSGLLGLAGIIWHIVWHWDWLKALRRRSLSEMPTKLRANRVVDRILWITFIATNVFAAMAWALPVGGVSAGVSLPERLHVAFGVAWTVLVLVHLGLHTKWIAATARRCLRAGA